MLYIFCLFSALFKAVALIAVLNVHLYVAPIPVGWPTVRFLLSLALIVVSRSHLVQTCEGATPVLPSYASVVQVHPSPGYPYEDPLVVQVADQAEPAKRA